jgi:hypothetical protein
MFQPYRVKYYIDVPSELSAGLRGYSDEITISVLSGDPGGEDGEFNEFVKDFLNEWFDGAKIRIIGIEKDGVKWVDESDPEMW